MKKYRVNVNGTNYEVELELVSENDVKATSAAPAPAAAPAAPVAAPAGAKNYTSPLPGTILSIAVAAGQQVKKGQVLMVLEAMKMENEILADADGTVVSVNATKGSSVESGALLCVIK